jgi:phosphatidylserine synthase 2
MQAKQNKIKQRNVGIQTIIQSKEYVLPKVAVTHTLEIEEYPKIFALPHTLLALGVVCITLFYLSRKSYSSIEDSLRNGLVGCLICIISFGCLFLPDSLFRRPHPVFWRFITSSALSYLLFVTLILFQGRDEARQFLSFFDKDLGKPLPEKNYADACSVTQDTFPFINLTNVYVSVDFYMTAHLMGWYVKMLIVRDVKICWFLSIFFEILEITFRHWLPNFWECWWDQAILDVLGMNALGIWLGDLTCRYFEMKNYNWITEKNLKADKSKSNELVKKVDRFLNYFTPNYWVKHQWNIFSSTKRFYEVIWFFVFMNLVDLSHFFMKYILWIPPTHNILHVRIYIWGLMAMISAREYYEYLNNPDTCKRIGINVWLSHLILFVEWSMIFKFSDGMFTEPTPYYIKYFWTLVFVIISGITIHLVIKDFINYFKKGKSDKKVDITEPEIEIEYLDNEESSIKAQ